MEVILQSEDIIVALQVKLKTKKLMTKLLELMRIKNSLKNCRNEWKVGLAQNFSNTTSNKYFSQIGSTW